MSNRHTELGDIAIPVGHYVDGTGKEKKRWRRIGVLMQTDYDDGGRSQWIKLNADALCPSLLIIARGSMEKGADTALLSVFTRKEKEKGKPQADGGEAEDDDIPF